jgi:Undecaprenyl-phosphate glucose phosphotransferase
VLVSALRLGFRMVFNSLRRRGFNQKTILVVGAGELGQRVAETIESHRELGFVVKGLLTRRPEKVGTTIAGVKVLGLFDQLGRVLDEVPVDQVILALPLEEQPWVKPLMEELAQRTVDVKVVPDLFQYMTLRGGLEEFGGLPIISLQGAPLDGWNLILKRAFDVVVAALALIVFSPVMVLVAVAVKLTSGGSVLYRQTRMGIDGHTFMMLKFRTMNEGAEEAGAQMATRDDPRKTVLGAFLRRFSLDELPQFLNVLWGDMSLVGPRPERPVFIEEFKKQIPRYHLRHMVKSGITGWAQVNGLRGQTSIEERTKYDVFYTENWSLAFDITILLKTIRAVVTDRNAY